MASPALIRKTLLSVALCCGVSQLSMAQRTMPEPPLAPRVPQMQLRTPMGVHSPADRAAKLTAPARVSQVAVRQPQPLFLLNSEVIIAPDGIQQSEIKKVMVFKGHDAPAQWHDLLTFGIIDITPKQKMKVKSSTLAVVGKRLGVLGQVRYTVNAMPVTDANLRIALDAIGNVNIMRVTESGVTTVAISVRPAKPSAPRQDPPGTIYIRGLAAH